MTTISFIVPTHREDRPLKRCLDSIAPQLRRRDEVIVCGDVLDGRLPGVEWLVKEYGHQFHYVSFRGAEHTYGHEQINHALTKATGDYISINDDDDVWAPNAAELIRKAADIWPGKPFLFRFRSYVGVTFWQQAGWFERNHIGGHCLVAPNVPEKLGCWAPEYSGDFDWLESTLAFYGGATGAIWLDDLIAVARPQVGALV